MREWVPISSSARGRLAVAALAQFGASSYENVSVGALAAAARVTTGALYHHFGSKRGLYDFVRRDVEQRLVDRIGGAVAAGTAGTRASVTAALTVSFDFAVREGFAGMLSSPPSDAESDRLASALGAAAAGPPLVGTMLAAAWRVALRSVADGQDSADARATLARMQITAP